MHTPILRYHGGKFRLSSWICSFFPKHQIYVEPYSGAASVLLSKPRSHGEVYNDLDTDVVNLFQVLRCEKSSKQLYEMCQLTPYSRDEFKLAYQKTDDPVEQARRTIVRSAMGFGTGAASGHRTGFRCDAKRASNTSAQCWVNYPAVIKWVTNRLRGVTIENRPALDCIRQADGPETLFYVDPPYLHSTRNLDSTRGVYKHEMSEADHVELLELLASCEGMVVLSGYESRLYAETLTGWRLEKKKTQISASKGTSVKTECLWLNPQCNDRLAKNGSINVRAQSRTSYVTHHMRTESTESIIKNEIAKVISAGGEVTISGIAKRISLSREHVSRRYRHLFSEVLP
ncbi:DNA adenine methylase [Photobacterium sp. CCB-ST2H9]|uniref:DNA adenine methylase n=1 Tax=Photobacterium sp. CCB-ST2H9 TaxID=2912855 RepID=UPI0020052ADF